MRRFPLVLGVFKLLGLTLAFVVLFIAGATVLGPGEQAGPPPPPDAVLRPLLVVAALDVPLLAALALGSRLRGWRLWALLSGFQWFVMTFTSQLEAAYFMPTVRLALLPSLLGMTLPLCLLFPPLLLAAFGLFRARPELAPAWRAPPMGRGELALKVALLSAVVYPVLFFAAGYFLAWQSPVLRQFYSGSTELLAPAEHFRRLLASDPLLYPFEVLRGALWVGAALAVLRTSRGPAWRTALLVAASFALVQNDLQLLPNPLMPAEVGRVHFVETASSNLVWGLCIGWLLSRSHLGREGHLPLAQAT